MNVCVRVCSHRSSMGCRQVCWSSVCVISTILLQQWDSFLQRSSCTLRHTHTHTRFRTRPQWADDVYGLFNVHYIVSACGLGHAHSNGVYMHCMVNSVCVWFKPHPQQWYLCVLYSEQCVWFYALHSRTRLELNLFKLISCVLVHTIPHTHTHTYHLSKFLFLTAFSISGTADS